jgi:hypothetical protein
MWEVRFKELMFYIILYYYLDATFELINALSKKKHDGISCIHVGSVVAICQYQEKRYACLHVNASQM